MQKAKETEEDNRKVNKVYNKTEPERKMKSDTLQGTQQRRRNTREEKDKRHKEKVADDSRCQELVETLSMIYAIVKYA